MARLNDVLSVTYDLHIPADVAPVLVLSTPSWPGTLENVTVESDNAAGTYSATMLVVTTKDADATVTATLMMLQADNELISSGAASGYSGDRLEIALTP